MGTASQLCNEAIYNTTNVCLLKLKALIVQLSFPKEYKNYFN